MAFSFGASTSSTPAFGAPQATPAFGAASSGGFSFGASSAPAFGTPTSTPAFGAPAGTPAFGASSAFGAGSTPAFGAPASTPAFGAPAATTGGFSFSTTTPSTGLFGQPAAQQAVASAPAFSFSQPQQAAAAQQQVAFTHATKFEDLDKATQDTLLQIQEQVSKYEADRSKVAQLEHLRGIVQLPQGLDADTSGLSAELRMLLATIKAVQDSLADFREKEIRLLKSTETVVRTYERTKLWRDATAMYQRQEPLKPAQQELLSQPVLLPGPFLEEAVGGFTSSCAEYSRCLEEVEQVLGASSLAEQPSGSVNWVTALPTIVANLHDYFVAVAAKLERTHSEVGRVKAAYMTRLRARGITADPFERARRQEQQHLMLQQQQQQQRLAAAAAGGHAALAALPAAQGAAGAIVPAGASPQTGLFGSQPATPGTPGFGVPFGSPFVSATPAPFGGAAAAGGLSRSTSASKGRSGKKR